jgi:NTE family protein
MPEPKFADLVLEGGGVKGVGLAGAYVALREAGYTAANVAGTSAGAITAAFIAADFPPEELEDKGWEDKVPLIEKTTSLLLDLGIYEGERFLEWMREMLAQQDVKTFGDLIRDPDETNPRYRYRLQVIASDVTNRKLLILPQDAGLLGIEPDELEVAYAVRMSMSIPIFFEPVRHVNPETNEEHVIVDGGMLSNYPVWLFDVADGEPPDWPTFGMLLVEPKPREHLGKRIDPPKKERGVGALIDYLKSMAQTMMAAHDRLYVEQADFARTIPIPTIGVGTTEFDITPARRRELFDSGKKATEDFLASWDFDAYVEEFRQGRQHKRRHAVLAEMGTKVEA